MPAPTNKTIWDEYAIAALSALIGLEERGMNSHNVITIKQMTQAAAKYADQMLIVREEKAAAKGDFGESKRIG